jgi:tetratricopeptide (TPR) repeat protein
MTLGIPNHEKLYGRDNSVEQLIHRLRHDREPLVVIGPPGVGKSSVAMVAFNDDRMQNKFAERRYWIPCNGISSSSSSLSEISNRIAQLLSINGGLSAYFRTPTPDSHLDSIIRTLKESKASMIVLDDLDDLWHHSDASIQDFASRLLIAICSISHVTVLVTIQGHIQSPPFIPHSVSEFRIEPLSPLDAERLFFDICPRYDHNLEQLFEKIGCFPSVIIRLANICKKQNVNAHALLAPLKEDPVGLLLPKPTDGLKTIQSIPRLIRHFPSASFFLSILAMLPNGIARSNQDRLRNDLRISDWTKLVEALLSLSVARWVHSTTNDDHSDRLQIPAHIRVQLLKGSYSLDFDDARKRLFSFYFEPAVIETYASPRRPDAVNSREVMESTRLEQENVETILRAQLVNGHNRSADVIKATIYYYKPLWGLRPCADIMSKAVTIAKEQDDPLLHARALQGLGETEQARGYYLPSQQHFEDALQIFKHHEDIQGQAACLHALGVLKHLCNPSSPLQHFEEAHEKFVMIDDRHGLAVFLLSWYELMTSPTNAVSLRLLNEASTIIDVLESPYLCARRDMATLKHNWLKWQKVCSVFRDTGDLVNLAQCLGSSKEALEIYRLLGRDLLSACCMRTIANSRFVPDQESVRLYDEAIPIFDAAHYTFHSAESKVALGHTLARLGKLHDAVGILRVTFPHLEYSPSYSYHCGIMLVRCLIMTGQLDATIGATQIILRYDDQYQGSCLGPLRKRFEELESRVRNGERRIVDESTRHELLALTYPDPEPHQDLDQSSSSNEGSETEDTDNADT